MDMNNKRATTCYYRAGLSALLNFLLGHPEPPFRTGLCFTRDVFFFRQPNLRGPTADCRETLPHDRNLPAVTG